MLQYIPFCEPLLTTDVPVRRNRLTRSVVFIDVWREYVFFNLLHQCPPAIHKVNSWLSGRLAKDKIREKRQEDAAVMKTNQKASLGDETK
jgi:hypothetical protein